MEIDMGVITFADCPPLQASLLLRRGSRLALDVNNSTLPA